MARVAIVGTGLLGRGIAQVAASRGFVVVLHDTSAASLAQAQTQVAAAVGEGAHVVAEPTLEGAVADAEFVIEAVIENLELKQQLFARMDAINPAALLMSNSSVLPIGQIAARTSAPQRAVGTHWWNPPQLIPVVEVVKGPATSAATMDRAVAFLSRLGKRPVRVERDLPGFVGNRLQHALWREAIALLAEGTEASRIDRIVAATWGTTLVERGPLAEIDHRGVPDVIRQFESVLPQISHAAQPAALLRERVARGELGAKSGRGFLSWAPGAREQAAVRLQQHVQSRLGAVAASPADREATAQLGAADSLLAMRLRVAMWREAMALVEHAVCDAATVDLMAGSTIGLRLAVMGPIENADYVGLDLTLAIHEVVLPSLESGRELPAWLRARARATAS